MATVDEWRVHLRALLGEIDGLVDVDDVFWQVEAISGRKGGIPHVGVMREWMRRVYTDTITVGIRRLVDTTKGTVSLRRLLDDMARHCTLLSRDDYLNQFVPLDRGDADLDFMRLAGGDLDHVPRARFNEMSNRLTGASRRVAAYANERVAHRARRQVSSGTYAQVRSALVEVVLIYEWTASVLNVSAIGGPTRVRQEPWLLAFSVPWLPLGETAPEYERLDQLMADARSSVPVQQRHRAGNARYNDKSGH